MWFNLSNLHWVSASSYKKTFGIRGVTTHLLIQIQHLKIKALALLREHIFRSTEEIVLHREKVMRSSNHQLFQNKPSAPSPLTYPSQTVASPPLHLASHNASAGLQSSQYPHHIQVLSMPAYANPQITVDISQFSNAPRRGLAARCCCWIPVCIYFGLVMIVSFSFW